MPHNPFTYEVFISHSAKDRAFVSALAADLVAAGVSVWLDQWSIRPGESIASALSEGISQSRFVLVVMSPDYFQSAWTKQEWHSGLAAEIEGRRVKLIPILYRDCEMPAHLRTKQWIDFRDANQYEASVGRLVRAIRSLSADDSGTTIARGPLQPGQRSEELDQASIRELKTLLEEARSVFRAQPAPENAGTRTTRPPETPARPPQCFVVMPFSDESLNIVYEDFIKPTLIDKCRLSVERGDDLFGSNVIMDDIATSIKNADLIVADLTSRNPNVFYEVGIAHAINKQVLLLTQSIDDVPFDLRHRRALVYEYSPRGCKTLESALHEHVCKMLGR